MIVGDGYDLIELVAVSWDEDMAERFPGVDHAACLQQMRRGEAGWEPFDPPRCIGWHCNRCGESTNGWGHHDCPDRPERQS